MVIGVALPLGAWLLTRGVARRPPAKLRPSHGRVDTWIQQRYGLSWQECSRVRTSVAQGVPVSDPVLADAVHGLAAATVSGKVPGQRATRIAARLNGVSGTALAAFAIISHVTRTLMAGGLIFIPQGLLLAASSCISSVQLRRQRRNAVRALELNRAVPGSTAS